MALEDSRADVVVIGGGLAGLTAALDLAAGGMSVTLLEARAWLGGATCSFARRGLTIDNGQHAFLRCCTAYLGFLGRLGVLSLAGLQDRLDLTVLSPDGEVAIRRSQLPVPLHLAPALAGYRLLTRAERARSATALLLLPLAGRTSAASGTLGDWLRRRGQRQAEIERLWDPLCSLATGLPAAKADLSMAASAIGAALLSSRDGVDIGVPAVPLSRLHATAADEALSRLGVGVLTGRRAVAIEAGSEGGFAVRHTAAASGARQPRGSAVIRADGVVLAVPPWDAAEIAPTGPGGMAACWAELEPSPVISVHVVYEQPVTVLPFAVAAGSPIRWITDKTKAAGLRTGQYLAATVPDAARYLDLPGSPLRAELMAEIGRLFPAAADTTVLDVFITRERRARVRQAPEARAARVTRDLPAGLALAGAWTDADWPDTMEGAVRSGQAAAATMRADLGAGGAERLWAAAGGEIASGRGGEPGGGEPGSGEPGSGGESAGTISGSAAAASLTLAL